MTKILNIDDLLDVKPAYAIQIGGKEHLSVQPSVEGFLANLKDMEALAAQPDLAAEIEVIVRMIVRSFPTLNADEIKKWPVQAIERLFAIVRGLEDEEKVAGKDSEGNAPSAA